MRRLVSIALVAALAAVANVTPASAKTISDPNETAIGMGLDIKSVTVVKPSAGKYAWTLVSWDSFTSDSISPAQPLELFLDVRNTTRADYVVQIYWNTGVSDELVCAVTTRSGSDVEAGTVSRPSSHSAKCVFSKSGLSQNKTVRWRAETVGLTSDDKAPNSGWVKGV
jgi:hypothetical protein